MNSLSDSLLHDGCMLRGPAPLHVLRVGWGSLSRQLVGCPFNGGINLDCWEEPVGLEVTAGDLGVSSIGYGMSPIPWGGALRIKLQQPDLACMSVVRGSESNQGTTVCMLCWRPYHSGTEGKSIGVHFGGEGGRIFSDDLHVACTSMSVVFFLLPQSSEGV